jgi:hypothetical protein
LGKLTSGADCPVCDDIVGGCSRLAASPISSRSPGNAADNAARNRPYSRSDNRDNTSCGGTSHSTRFRPGNAPGNSNRCSARGPCRASVITLVDVIAGFGYASGHDVLCYGLNCRDCVLTSLGDTTDEALFVAEALDAPQADEVGAALNSLGRLLAGAGALVSETTEVELTTARPRLS